MRRWHIVSPVPALAVAAVPALGLLDQLYPGVNSELSGPRLLAAVLLGGIAILILIESFNRGRSRQHWRTVCGVGALIWLISLGIAFAPVSHVKGSERGFGLSLTPVSPYIFHVAFKRQIPLPSAEEDWPDLHRRGGIDVGDSSFRLRLVNESSVPVFVLGMHAEVLGSEPMPHGTDTWHYSQGDEGLGHFATLLPDGRRGSIGRIYDGSVHFLDKESLAHEYPYFNAKYIQLRPGEVFPATLTVQANTPRIIRYRLVATGESATRKFVVRSPVYQLLGRFEDRYQTQFARYYVKEHDPHACTEDPDNPWVDASRFARSPTCPHGLGMTFEVAPPDPARFPPGRFRLTLGLAPGAQSAAIDGIPIGAAPAASPRRGMVHRILESLGAWSSCSEYWPSPEYWSASWERPPLRLTFAGEDPRTDCTPASSSSVHEISLEGSHTVVDTDLGPVTLGALASELPARLLRAGSLEEQPEYTELVFPGVSACDPRQVESSRTQTNDEQGGILALGLVPSSAEITSLTTTLPTKGC